MLLHEDWRTAPPDANKTIEFWQAAYRCGASMCFESSRIDVRHVGEAPSRRRNARNRFIVSPGLIRKPWSVVRTCKRPRSVQVSEPPERLRSERTHRRPSGMQHGALKRFTARRSYPHRPSLVRSVLDVWGPLRGTQARLGMVMSSRIRRDLDRPGHVEITVTARKP